MPTEYNILLVEDSEADARFFRQLLEGDQSATYRVSHRDTLASALETISETAPDVIFLGFMLPDSDGFLSISKLSEAAPRVPIIIMTSIDNEEIGVRAIQRGAQDYLVKGNIYVENLGRTIRYAIERKRTQENVVSHLDRNEQNGERHFREIVDSLTESILIVDEDSVVRYANPATETLLGRPAQEMIGEISPFRIPDSQFQERELRIRGQVLTLEVQSISTHWKDQAAHLVSLHDITEEDHERRHAQAQSPESRRTQAAEGLARLAAGIAHDYRNLLMGIMGNTALALMELPPESSARKYLDQIQTATRRASDLTNKMLTYSGRTHFRFQKTRLQDIIREVKPILEPSVPENIHVDYEIPSTLTSLTADPNHLRQAIVNLVVNAWEAIGEDPGTITLHADQGDCPEQSDLVFGFAEEAQKRFKHVWFQVEDTGPGIPDEVHNQIFEPFFTTRFAGRGLGLSTVLGVIRAHKGGIGVRNKADGGACFTLFLPTELESEAIVESPVREPEPVEADWRGKGRILVVDDEKMILAVCKRYIENLGFDVITACDGQEAVDVYRHEGDALDAVILDLNMPRMNGHEAFKRIREINPDARVIISTGFAEEEVRADFADENISGLLEKPYEPGPLAATLRDALTK